MSIDNAVSRRALLAAGAAGAGTLALAACGSSGSDTKADPTTAAPKEPAGATGPGADPSTSSAASSAASSDSSGSGGAAALVAVSAVAVGQSVSVKLPGGKPGIVSRPSASSVKCFSAICTHQGCTVKPAGATLDCPCHGSRYDAFTGKVLNGPAPSPLPAVPVKVVSGEVVPD